MKTTTTEDDNLSEPSHAWSSPPVAPTPLHHITSSRSSSRPGSSGGAPPPSMTNISSPKPVFDPAWRWGNSDFCSPKTNQPIESRLAFQQHVRLQSSNFDGESSIGSVGQGMTGLRRSSLIEKTIYSHDLSLDMDLEAASLDPLRERAITRHGLSMQPPPEIDKLEELLEMVALTNQGWAFGISIAMGSRGLVKVVGDEWSPKSPISQNHAFHKCCQNPDQVVALSPRSSFSSASGFPNHVSSSCQPSMYNASRGSDLTDNNSVHQNQIGSKDFNAYDKAATGTETVAAARAICLSPAFGLHPVVVGMLYGFAQRPTGCTSKETLFIGTVDRLGRLAVSAFERSAVSMRRQRELLAQQSLVSMKRYISGEMPSMSLATQNGTFYINIFSQAATAIRAVLNAHSCVIWDISCFRLFSLGNSNASNGSDLQDSEPGAELMWPEVKQDIQAANGSFEIVMSRRSSAGQTQALGEKEKTTAAILDTKTKSSNPSVGNPSWADSCCESLEDPCGKEYWTCSYPVTCHPISVIGNSGAEIDHFLALDGLVSRPLVAEFLATTRDLGFHSQAQAQGEHFKTTEMSFFGEASSLGSLLSTSCEGLIAVPIFEIDQQPAFLIFATFDEKPVLEAADRHFVEQVGDVLLNSSIRSRVQVVDRAQTHFIQKIQHELRTPLHAVIGTLDALREAVLDSSSLQDAAARAAELGALVKSATVSADALNDMINNILDFGALKAMPFQSKDATDLVQVTYQDICATISECCLYEWTSLQRMGEFYQPNTQENGDPEIIEPASAAPPPPELFFDLAGMQATTTAAMSAAIDLDAIKTVVRKLVNNAIRATRTGFIAITLRLTGERPMRQQQQETLNQNLSKPRSKIPTVKHFDIELTVEDTGKGMHKEFLESHLFAPYAKENTFLPGSGLSLAIASRLVHRMGGHINVASSLETGTKFVVKFPVRFDDKRSTASPSRPVTETTTASAYFIGFESPTFMMLKDILMRCANLSEASVVQDSCLVFVVSEALGSSSLNTAIMDLAQTCKDGKVCPNIVVLQHPSKVDNNSANSLDTLIREHDPTLAGNLRTIPRPVDYKGFKTIASLKDRTTHETRPRITSNPSQFSISTQSSNNPVSPLSTPCSLESRPPFFFPEGEIMVNAQASFSKGDTETGISSLQQTELEDVDDVRAAAVSLAVEPATLIEVQVAATSFKAPQDFTVMIVEDNPLNMRIMTTMLDRAKIHYIQAWNGQEAVDLFRQHLPQVVLLDITMPIMDGFQACAEIRKIRPVNFVHQDGSPCHRIIAVTALSSDADRLRGRELGMDDWLKKPLKMSSLMDDLKAWKKAQTVSAV